MSGKKLWRVTVRAFHRLTDKPVEMEFLAVGTDEKAAVARVAMEYDFSGLHSVGLDAHECRDLVTCVGARYVNDHQPLGVERKKI